MPLLKGRSSQGQNLFLRAAELSTTFHSLSAQAQRVSQLPTPISIGDLELCAYWHSLASAISDLLRPPARTCRKSARRPRKISFRPQGVRSRREPRQSASVVADPAPRASPKRD